MFCFSVGVFCLFVFLWRILAAICPLKVQTPLIKLKTVTTPGERNGNILKYESYFQLHVKIST